MDNYIYIFIIVNILALLYLLVIDKDSAMPLFNNVLTVLICFISVICISTEDISPYSDKYMYLNNFEEINFENIWEYKDVGFAFYTFIVKSLYDNSKFYFFLTAFIYVFSYYYFISKYILPKYRFILLLAILSSFGFYAYGSNTLRAGFALGFVLLAIGSKKNLLFILFSFAAILVHKSMLLPLGSFLLAKYIKDTRIFIGLWILALLISIINFSPIVSLVQNYIVGADDRGNAYFNENNIKRYKTGFRLDFVIYSIIPMIVGYIYIFKLKVKDAFYQRFYKMYILSNAIWIIVIRMAFTDRVAYLSWFIIPVILLYPLIKYYLPINQRIIVFFTLLGIIFFSSFMHFK